MPARWARDLWLSKPPVWEGRDTFLLLPQTRLGGPERVFGVVVHERDVRSVGSGLSPVLPEMVHS